MKRFIEKLANEANNSFKGTIGIWGTKPDGTRSDLYFGTEEFKTHMADSENAKKAISVSYREGYVDGAYNHCTDGVTLTGIVGVITGTMLGWALAPAIDSAVESIAETIAMKKEIRKTRREIRKILEEKYDIKIKKIVNVGGDDFILYYIKDGQEFEIEGNYKEIKKGNL